jgi:glutamate synthase (NADPH/NADH) small chain
MHGYNKQPIEIGRLQRYAMDKFYAGGAKLPPPVDARAAALKVACIGGGPASLACASPIGPDSTNYRLVVISRAAPSSSLPA